METVLRKQNKHFRSRRLTSGLPEGKGDKPDTKSRAPDNEGSSNCNATATRQEGACPAVTPPHHTPSALSQNHLLRLKFVNQNFSEDNGNVKTIIEYTFRQ